LKIFDSKSAQICTKSFSGWDFAPYPTGGAHSAPPDPVPGKGEKERMGREEEGKRGKRKEGKGREGRGGCQLPPLRFKSGYALAND